MDQQRAPRIQPPPQHESQAVYDRYLGKMASIDQTNPREALEKAKEADQNLNGRLRTIVKSTAPPARTRGGRRKSRNKNRNKSRRSRRA
jgi:hypothetical protein